MNKEYGPQLPISQEIHQAKYRGEGETFEDSMDRIASTLSDNKDHRHSFKRILLNQRFMPAGRVQSAVGSPRRVTAINCFASGTILDQFEDIMDKAKEAGITMRMGGGIGYDWSPLRPRNSLIKSMGSRASGPVSFMDIFNAICGTVASAGHRRGAQMAVLRVDHPDIMEFIHAKQNSTALTRFNISVAVTNEFMEAVKKGEMFDLRWGGHVYDRVDACSLWDQIMRSTWHWAEPGVVFIDRMNQENNLWYCETIYTTNPCSEQPLPPYGACLLGSFNLVKYVRENKTFDWGQFEYDIRDVVRAMDNVVDNTIYPLPQQEKEEKDKRRMGLGVTGTANALEIMGLPYASEAYIRLQSLILEKLRNECYETSSHLAAEKGSFPLFDVNRYLEGSFIKRLPDRIRNKIRRNGIRNSHLTSIAPTGTISLSADNISGGIEPVFSYGFTRTIQTFEGPVFEEVSDYAYREFGVEGVKANDVTAEEHVMVLNAAQYYVDSACSKTCNIGDDVSWERFKNVYMKAYEGGAKGCTTFRAAGKRYGIFNENKPDKQEYIDDEDSLDSVEGEACFIDERTGQPSCS